MMIIYHTVANAVGPAKKRMLPKTLIDVIDPNRNKYTAKAFWRFHCVLC